MVELEYSHKKKYAYGPAINILFPDIEVELAMSEVDGEFLISLFRALNYAGIYIHEYDFRKIFIESNKDSKYHYWTINPSTKQYVTQVPIWNNNYRTICSIDQLFKNRYCKREDSYDATKFISYIDDFIINTYLAHLQDMITITTLIAYGTFISEKIAKKFYSFANRDENYESQYYISKKNVFKLLRNKNIEDVTFTEFAQLYATDKPHIYRYSRHSIAHDIKRTLSRIQQLPSSKEDFVITKLYYDIKYQCETTINTIKDILNELRAHMRTDEEIRILNSVYSKIDQYFSLPTIILQFLINSEIYKWCQTQYIMPNDKNSRSALIKYSCSIESPLFEYLRYVSSQARLSIQKNSNAPHFIKTTLETEPEQSLDLFINEWHVANIFNTLFLLFTSRAFKKHFMKEFDANNYVQILLSRLLPARYFYSREYKRVETLVNQIEKKLKRSANE